MLCSHRPAAALRLTEGEERKEMDNLLPFSEILFS